MTTINEFPMCKYVGEGAYVMWMVCDNSEFGKLDPLEAGVIEEYALKMAESLEIIENQMAETTSQEYGAMQL